MPVKSCLRLVCALSALILFALFFGTTSLSLAQSTSAELSGVITDAKGAVVPEVEVVATSIERGNALTTKTNGSGIYVFSDLLPGHYHVDVRKEGFKGITVKDLEFHVEDKLQRNFTLDLGSISETVTVNGSSAVINTTDGTVSTTVDRNFAANIPLNGRSFQSLLLLSPGVVLVPSGGTSSGGQFSVNGQRSTGNNFTVDGVSANNGNSSPPFFGGPASSGNLPQMTALGTTQSLVSVDAMQEFKIQTSTYAAEYGPQPGGQIAIITRSGTNQYHGNLFEYLRNTDMDANDWFANYNAPASLAAHSAVHQAEHQNDFGGTVGGPIKFPFLYNGHDRTFFFFSYEGLRLLQPTFQETAVPGLCVRGLAPATGPTSCAAENTALGLPNGATLPALMPAPAAILPALNGFPLPNSGLPDVADGLNTFAAGYSQPSTIDAVSFRIDHTVNSKLTLFGRYNNSPSEGVTRNSLNLSGLSPGTLVTHTITLGATYLLTPSISNDLRANYSGNGAYSSAALSTFGGAVIPMRSLFLPSVYDTPAAGAGLLFNFTARPAGTNGGAPNVTVAGTTKITSMHQWNIVDNLSWVKGAHRFKFGVDYRKIEPVIAENIFGITAQFTNISQVYSLTAPLIAVAANPSLKPRLLNQSFYGQDTWSISRRLTLDLGLRWDINPAPTEANGHDMLALTEVTNLATATLAPYGTPVYKTTWYNFGPRLGAAYQISRTPGHETVLRGGFGVFYDTGTDQDLENYLATFPLTASHTISNTTITFPFTNEATQLAPSTLPNPNPVSNLFTGLPTSPLLPYFNSFDPNLKLPFTLQWNIAVEQSFGRSQTLTVTYVGAQGNNLLQAQSINLTGINPHITTTFLTTNDAYSNYNGLQGQFQRRMSHGLQTIVSYTWMHALANDSASFTGKVAQYGNASFDIRQALHVAAIYNIPAPSNALGREILGNWSLDTAFQAQTAAPLDLIGNTFTLPDGSLANGRVSVVSGIPWYLPQSMCGAPTAAQPRPGPRCINNTPNDITAAQAAAVGCQAPSATTSKGPFCVPIVGNNGNLGPFQVRGLGAWEQDLAIQRVFPIKERLKLQFRAEAFNIYNHPNFGNAQTTLSSGGFGEPTNMLNAQLGGISALYQIGGPRSLQMALKLMF